MRARFNDGPYNEVVLELNDTLDHVLLPVKIATDIGVVKEQTFYCQARYRLHTYNSVEARYQFEGIDAP